VPCAGNACSLPINKTGTILSGSEVYGPTMTGYTQCAGFKNTSAWDIAGNDWVHTCAGNGSKKWRVQVYDTVGKTVVFTDDFPSWTQTELSNNISGCDNNGYGTCGKMSSAGSGRALIVYKPNNGNGGCHGDDNSRGALRITTGVSGDGTMGKNHLFVGGHVGGDRQHTYGSTPESEIRYPGGGTWDGCGGDARTTYAVLVYLEN